MKRSRQPKRGHAICKVCGEKLTNPVSIARGMGPTCSKKRIADQSSAKKLQPTRTTLFGLRPEAGQILVGLSSLRGHRFGIVALAHGENFQAIATYDDVQTASKQARAFVLGKPYGDQVKVTLVTRRSPEDLETYLALKKRNDNE